MKTYELQKDFFIKVTQVQDKKSSSVAIYQDLVYNRLENVIRSTYPVFCDFISEDKLKKLLKEFLVFGSNTPFVWKIPLEFYNFMNTKKMDLCQKDILLFESIQLKVYANNTSFKKKRFDWNKKYRLSSHAVVLKLHCDPSNRKFEELKIHYIFIFKEIYDFEVYHIPISEFLYRFFMKFRNNLTAKQVLNLICKQMNLDKKSTKKLLEPTLIEFANKGLFV